MVDSAGRSALIVVVVVVVVAIAELKYDKEIGTNICTRNLGIRIVILIILH